jgi:hypothetical protein
VALASPAVIDKDNFFFSSRASATTKRQYNRMHKSFTLFFLLLGNFSLVRAQFTITPISLHKSPGSTWLSYSFPFVKGTNKMAAQSINSLLQDEILQNNRTIVDSNRIFEKSRYINNDSVDQSGYSEIDCEVLLNNSRVLTLLFDMESTGAYSTMYPLYYSFDSKTGKRLSFTAIFNPAVRPVISKRLLAERKKRVREYIKEAYADSKDTSYIKETYEECLAEDDIDNFYVRAGSIVFYKEFCFPHAARPYETDLDVEIPLKELRSLLTPYGRTIFGIH